MDIKEYLSDIDKIYTYDNGVVEELLDLSTVSDTSLIINDTGIDRLSTFNRNITVLNKEIEEKLPKTKTFYGINVECNAPAGYILVTDGPGQEPYWVDPILFKESMATSENIDTEKLSYNYNTFTSTLFSTLFGATVSNKIEITDDESNIILNSTEIPETGQYQFKMRIAPIRKDILTYGSDHIMISGAEFDETYTFVASTSAGLIQLDVSSTEVIDGNTKINIENSFGAAYILYIFKINLSADVYTDTVSYKKQYIEDIILSDGDLYINYVAKECTGTKIKFQLNANNGLVFEYIDIELITI